ncbi:serine/threonine-protein kinase [Nonomuraea sp. NPDC048826]|uniref:serine/threonine-protein kinase n=1 Tax=Nonomuraea sp. NPDC048826 TaxID=3364347 RepID=UPI0037141A7C
MRLGNRYLLVSRIAAGGMGEVWRARDELLGREVAVKVLHSHIHADPAFRGRFRNEARITAALTDHGIAQIFDYGEQADLAYLVMELVHGEPLSAILTRNGPLGAEVTLDVLHQTAKALHAAHSSGVIHRDIKPGNLLVTPEGTIKVTDFGIARALEAAPVTQTGTVLGTAQYVSPEQAQGLTLTPSTDLYSLGVVAYECLSGRPPFHGDSAVAIALRHLNEQPPPLGVDVPAPVRALVMALLAKDPAHRPGSALELADRAYVLRESLTTGGDTALGSLTDPAGFPVRPRQEDPAPVGPGTLGGAAAVTEVQAPPRRRRVGRTVATVAAAGTVAAVGFSALALAPIAQAPLPTTPETTNSPLPASVTPRQKPPPNKTKTSRPPAVTVKSTRPVASPSATVSKSATPTRRPTPSPTPTKTRTPTPTPTPTPTTTPTTPTPSASPDPGDSNPPKEET